MKNVSQNVCEFFEMHMNLDEPSAADTLGQARIGQVLDSY